MRQALKKCRISLQLSQKDIANRINMSQPNYAHIESGRHEPNLKIMEAIFEVLQIDKTKTDIIDFFRNYLDEEKSVS